LLLAHSTSRALWCHRRYSVCEEHLIDGAPFTAYPAVCHFRRSSEEVGWEGIDWIDLAEDRDRWRAAVNAVMNLRVP
jgi:hypothetical protein